MPEHRKKLIEVALPLEAINAESAREKSIRHGHPSTLHLWWARRPLAACRAVLFAQLVDDPSSHPDKFPTEQAQEEERKRLFAIIEELVKWENTNNERVLEQARREILASTGGKPPPVLDPFCGGGSIPLEAQRLGLEAHGSDLNPVAVLITKALIEIPPRFAGRRPVHPREEAQLVEGGWRAVQGLAEDVRYYGRWMRAEAQKRIGHLYPQVSLPTEHGGGDATVIAWIWARTVTCPNPACGARMPLVRSFALSTRKGKEACVTPTFDHAEKRFRYGVRLGAKEAPQGTVNRRGGRCLACESSVPFKHVRSEGQARRMAEQLMAVVAEGRRGRIYLAPDDEQVTAASAAEPTWRPEAALPQNPRDFKTPNYGIDSFAALFTARQLVALTTFSDLVSDVQGRVQRDAVAAGMADDGVPLAKGGSGAQAYADAVATYLAFAVDKSADYWSTVATWASSGGFIRDTFARQALPMTWDFAECNPFSNSTANWLAAIEWIVKALRELPVVSSGRAKQLDATTAVNGIDRPLICTDPPYYDNIGYADLSDFFYVWLRRSLGSHFPALFTTLLTPKANELIASPYRFDGDRKEAERFFEQGLKEAFQRMRDAAHPDCPIAVFYAFKQAESDSAGGIASTGWETMLSGLLETGFAITGTWPMRTERGGRSIAVGTNALASSIVLACRPRAADAALATRREFLSALKEELPEALRTLQHGNVAPVDLAQAAIGPGMAVFSRYAKVVEAGGTRMDVRTALALINEVLDDVLAEQEGEFDADTRWALAWYEQRGLEEGAFGEADVLARAKNTSVQGLQEAGILEARAGKVRLLRREELDGDWDPTQDARLTVWEVTQHLIARLENEGEAGAAALLRQVGALGDAARDLAYRLYGICERKKWAKEAFAFNSLVVAWPTLAELAQRAAPPRQGELI